MLPVESLGWRDGQLRILDQTLLPARCVERTLECEKAVWEAIRALRVRGAPAIGVCAAFGVVLGVRARQPDTAVLAEAAVRDVADYLATSRPTAVNLFWALDRMRAAASAARNSEEVEAFIGALDREAVRIWDEDRQVCRQIGEFGADLIPEGAGVLTHCNTGGLAAAGEGTALAVIAAARRAGKTIRVYAGETRPLLQGARLTMWELGQLGIESYLICDSAAAHLMRSGKVQAVVVGADRIAANGDAANKIGTYGIALLARAHAIPFYVAAPLSSVDPDCRDGAAIPIEERDEAEVLACAGVRTAPEGARAWNPAFDITPADCIRGIITEQGVLNAPYEASIARALADARATESAAHA